MLLSVHKKIVLLFCLLFLFENTRLSKTHALLSSKEQAKEQSLINQADQFIQSGQRIEAIQTLELFLVNSPESPRLPDVFIKLGDLLTAQGDFKKAVEAFQVFLKRFPSESRAPTVRHSLSLAYLKMGNVEEALGMWSAVSGQETLKSQIYQRAIEVYTEREDYPNALRALIQKNAWRSPLPEAESDKEAVLAIIQHRLSEAEMERVISEFSPNFPADEAALQLIRRYDKGGLPHQTEKAIRRFLKIFPSHPYAAEVQAMGEAIRETIKKNRFRMAVLLPLSGTLAAFGESALRGIQLALLEFQEALPGIPIALVVKDINDPAESGREALLSWLAEYKPIGIVGPLRSQEVNQVAPLAEKGGWAIITPGASAETLALQGKTVFRNTITPRSQCRDLAQHAVEKLNIKRMALLVPEGELGKTWVTCMTEGLNLWGGKVAVVKSYSSKAVDFKAPILHLKNVFRKPVEGSPHGFDALFLPDNARRVGLIIPQLAFHNLNEVTLMGTMGWNNPEFLKLVGPHAENAIFIDGFFVHSPDPLVQHFVQQYRKQFQQDPDLFAAQAYDATHLILAAMKRGASTPSAVKQAIAATSDFPAVSGYIYEMKEGVARKKPYILQIQKGHFVQIN